ncbi:addiction module antidote protein [Synechococcus sp. PCC 7336]|uniref:addiction module antidote protein n=1 Tax=Synechococcus sp. PCC 7336 TaxID=195250 RepID=UPI00034B7436|nr:addiction module antidote protein [Synechococcus sp. PCC 7336]
MSKYRTLDQVEEDYFRKHPEEIEDYIALIFEEFSEHGDTGALLASLRSIARVRGVTATAEAAGMSRKGLQKALSEEGNPKLASVNAIMQALGYRLAPQKLVAT